MTVRAVLDTNVVVSAVLNPAGTPAAVARGAGEAYQLVWTLGIITECLRVIGSDKILRRLRAAGTEDDARATVARLAALAELVPPERLPRVRAIKDDPSDDLFVATALAGGASVLVSGDRRHVLPLREYGGVRFIDAATFASELGLAGHPPRPGGVHEPVARWGDGVRELAAEARRWKRARANRRARGHSAPP